VVIVFPAMTEELVVLVDDHDNQIGTAPKSEVHHGDTPLHRAFSCFLINAEGELLLQQRASTKVTWPRIWSNSCCGHPLPGEPREEAVRRRLRDELGLEPRSLALALPDYRYRAEHLGVVENEICPVWIGPVDNVPTLNEAEVMAVRWVSWRRFIRGVRDGSEPFYRDLSPWCREEALLLDDKGVLDALVRSENR